MTEFKIGDKVSWYSTDTGISYEGILQGDLERPNILFGPGSPFQQRYTYKDYTFSDWRHITLAMSDKEKVSRKIKLLWNQSNWVKKNPSQMITT